MPHKTQLTLWQNDKNDRNVISKVMERTNPGGAESRVQIERGGVSGLRNTLDRLVNSQWTYSNITFDTHGGPGFIEVGDNPADTVGNVDFEEKLGGRGYERLLPNGGVVEFAGCNSAMGRHGWEFLEAAGKTFLRGGGIVLGYRFKGWVFPKGENTYYLRYNPMIIHPWFSRLLDDNACKYIKFGRGGQVEKRFGAD